MDGLRKALILLEKSPDLDRLGIDIEMLIHDEIVVGVDEEKAEKAKVLLERCMIETIKEFFE